MHVISTGLGTTSGSLKIPALPTELVTLHRGSQQPCNRGSPALSVENLAFFRSSGTHQGSRLFLLENSLHGFVMLDVGNALMPPTSVPSVSPTNQVPGCVQNSTNLGRAVTAPTLAS